MTTHRVYYASQDVATNTHPLATWSVYSEEYVDSDSDELIPNTTRRVSRHANEAEADAEAHRLADIHQHVERAEVLIANLDGQWDSDGRWTGSGGFVTTPPVLTLAQVHLQLADMKMKGA